MPPFLLLLRMQESPRGGGGGGGSVQSSDRVDAAAFSCAAARATAAAIGDGGVGGVPHILDFFMIPWRQALRASPLLNTGSPIKQVQVLPPQYSTKVGFR